MVTKHCSGGRANRGISRTSQVKVISLEGTGRNLPPMRWVAREPLHQNKAKKKK